MTTVTVEILALGGSLRRESHNRMLCSLAAERARSRGAKIDLVDVRALNVPFYDHDVELSSGLPADVRALRDSTSAVR